MLPTVCKLQILFSFAARLKRVCRDVRRSFYDAATQSYKRCVILCTQFSAKKFSENQADSEMMSMK